MKHPLFARYALGIDDSANSAEFTPRGRWEPVLFLSEWQDEIADNNVQKLTATLGLLQREAKYLRNQRDSVEEVIDTKGSSTLRESSLQILDRMIKDHEAHIEEAFHRVALPLVDDQAA